MSITIYPDIKPNYYICNRKRCQNCAKECMYTSDIEYALYDTHDDFEPTPSGRFERVRK